MLPKSSLVVVQQVLLTLPNSHHLPPLSGAHSLLTRQEGCFHKNTHPKTVFVVDPAECRDCSAQKDKIQHGGHFEERLGHAIHVR